MVALAQSPVAPKITWQKTVGGISTDSLTAIAISNDHKSFVVCGSSNSKKSGNKTIAAYGGYDYWVVKMDSSGNILWDRSLGG